MKTFLAVLVLLGAFIINAQKAQAQYGANVGIGLPYATQLGVNYVLSDEWTFNANYNNLSMDIGDAGVDLTMPEFMANWHPFQGSFYLGLGLGLQSFEASSSVNGISASANVDSTVAIAKLGWMWGISDGGFWGGMDVAYVNPLGSSVDIKGAGNPGDASYDDVEDAANTFAETAYLNITFLRLGYIF